MKRVLRILAVGVNVSMIAAGLSSFFTIEAPLSVMAWGSVIVILFGALTVALLRPQWLDRRPRIFAALCIAIPSLALIGSLDLGIISGLEWIAIALAAIVAVLNWLASNPRAQAIRKAA